MRNCSSCAQTLPEAAERCPACGALLDGLEGELLALLGQQKMIEAVKLCRERTGLGLKEAKDLVDGLAAGRRGILPAPAPKPPAGPLDAELLALLKAGKTIEAVKLHRERTGLGLKESKDAVDALAARERLKLPRGGCLLLFAGFL